MSQKLAPARVPTPGKILSRELEARGWTQKYLAEIMGHPVQTINETHIPHFKRQKMKRTAMDNNYSGSRLREVHP